MSRALLYCGDAATVLRHIASESVHCVVTSPPYWGLRDYGVPGQLGLERTPDEYVAKLVAIFREVRRVMRPDATLWLNMGDCYASTRACGGDNPVSGLKGKDLVGIPWRVAFALQADGWWLRSDIIWSKPNPMPESVRDRPTRAHDYVFLLSRSERYYYDATAIAEASESDHPSGNGFKRPCQIRRGGRGSDNHWQMQSTRNSRTVWTIPTQPYPHAHFATFPEELARQCILAGSSPRTCERCGAPWERVTETMGWSPGCDCEERGVGRAVVLDPFGGSGTVAQVATGAGRDSIYVDLNPEYLELAKLRIGPMFCDSAVAVEA